MFILDTDTLTHLLYGHSRITERRGREGEDVFITAITRIEILQGRFASVVKAEDGEKTRLAQERLDETERDLEAFEVLPFDAASGAELDRLFKAKGLKKIGRCDLLIAAITLAKGATLATC